MLEKFNKRVLQALNSMRVNSQQDFEIVMQALKDETNRIDNVTRTCQSDRLIAWNQGATQTLSEFVNQAEDARATLLQLRENVEAQEIDNRNELRHRAI
jgi:hypothetical protein